MRIRARPVGTAVMVAALVAATALAVSGQTPTAGGLDDHSRFTSLDAPYPPQPVGLRNIQIVSPTTFATAAAPDDYVRMAQDDPDVRAALGNDPALSGVEVLGPKQASLGDARVTWFAIEHDMTVTATVLGGRVIDIEEVPAAQWQPALTQHEGERAVAIGRSFWIDEGRADAQSLDGFVMHTMESDGEYPDRRLAYVTFAEHVDARPQLLTWVDLSSGTVERSRTESGSPSPSAPSHSFAQGTSESGAPRQGDIEWSDWNFTYEVSGRDDGISLNDVTYRGVPILSRASMPSMTVFYDDDACGPFVDRLGGQLFPVEWADDAEVVLREFEQYGQRWLELGILDILGEYVLYQNFYIGQEGQIDAHTFAKGLQCETDHVHYPFWRFDFDLAGTVGDTIRRPGPDGEMVAETEEFDLSAADAIDHAWQVHDMLTDHVVQIDFDDGGWNVPGDVLPESVVETNRVYGRRYHSAEASQWRDGALAELPGNEGEDIDGQDLVLWYRGFLPHSAAEGPALWHSTGVRLDVDLAADHFIRSD